MQITLVAKCIVIALKVIFEMYDNLRKSARNIYRRKRKDLKKKTFARIIVHQELFSTEHQSAHCDQITEFLQDFGFDYYCTNYYE